MIAALCLSACSANAQPAGTYEVTEIAVPAMPEDADRFERANPHVTRYRKLAETLQAKAAGEIKAKGAKPVSGHRTSDYKPAWQVAYAASDERFISYAYRLPTGDDTQVVSACRFETEFSNAEDFQRRIDSGLGSFFWPHETCAAPKLDSEAIAALDDEFLKIGYRRFRTVGTSESSAATLISLPFEAKGTLGFDPVLDFHFKDESAVMWSQRLPFFRTIGGVAQLADGRTVFIFSPEPEQWKSRSACILEGISWEDFSEFDRSRYVHPLKKFCKQAFEDHRYEYMRALDRAADKEPIRVGPTLPGN